MNRVGFQKCGVEQRLIVLLMFNGPDGPINPKKDSVMRKGHDNVKKGGVANVTEDYLQSKKSKSSDKRPSECSLNYCNKCSKDCL